MDLSAPMLWWIAAGALVAVEMLSGTFYLLMLALGCAAGALAAHAGAGASAQVAVAALCGAGATGAWHLRRARTPRSAPAERNRDVNLDIGSPVQVPAWQDDRTARVQYRGALWSARLTDGAEATAGAHVIVSVRGNELELAPAR